MDAIYSIISGHPTGRPQPERKEAHVDRSQSVAPAAPPRPTALSAGELEEHGDDLRTPAARGKKVEVDTTERS